MLQNVLKMVLLIHFDHTFQNIKILKFWIFDFWCSFFHEIVILGWGAGVSQSPAGQLFRSIRNQIHIWTSSFVKNKKKQSKSISWFIVEDTSEKTKYCIHRWRGGPVWMKGWTCFDEGVDQNINYFGKSWFTSQIRMVVACIGYIIKV